MTWAYDVTTLSTNQTAQVRLIVGDTVSAEQLVQDEEIALALAQRNSVYGAAAMMALAIAAKFSRLSNVANGVSRHDLSQKADNYRKLALELDAKDDQFGGAMPFAGGLSASDLQTAAQDTSRVQSAFALGMDDFGGAYGITVQPGAWP